ncbi:MAG: mechanosensitive ion channel domain-containing protein [Rikenellaceae bacterium]
MAALESSAEPEQINMLKLEHTVERLSDMNIGEIFATIGGGLFHFAVKLIIAVAIYFIGRWVIKRVMKLMDVAFERRLLDNSLSSFLKSMVTIVIYGLTFLMIIQVLGVSVTSIVALLASAGLAVGMALGGTLQNFAGGVMILLIKPYNVGDYITAQGQSGTVREILLFTTMLETLDGHTIFVPNSSISSSIIDNYSHSGVRRVDWRVGITYGDSVDLAREVILEILHSDKRVILNERGAEFRPAVGVDELSDSAVTLLVRGWVVPDDYWEVYWDIYERIYKGLPANGLHFPFPQMDIHIKESLNINKL